MAPLYFTLSNHLKVMVIPDTEAHLDGHSIITHTYSIFQDVGGSNPLIARSKESTLHLEVIKDPNYYGFITFEIPGRLFVYTSDGQKELSADEASELIDHLSNIRDNPALWNNLNAG